MKREEILRLYNFAKNRNKKTQAKMQTVKLKNYFETPKNFTGIAEYPNGEKHWYKEGNLHREDGPAVEWENGTKQWWIEGNLHREDGPAKEYSNGYKAWYKEGRFHREDGPAVEWENGNKERHLKDDNFNTTKTKPSKTRQVAIRVASRQIIKNISALITKTLTQGFKASDSQKLISWFKTEAGSAVIMVLVGKLLPRFEALLPEEYKAIFSEIAEEIEIETMVDLTDGVVDSIAAAIVSFDFNSFQFFNSESETAENVRVETPSAPTVTPWVSVQAEQVEQSAIKATMN